jgi:hypothetical protein
LRLTNSLLQGQSRIDRHEVAEERNRIVLNVISASLAPLSTDVWRKPLADGSMAMALLNRGTEETTITADWKDMNVASNKSLIVRDLWRHKDLGVFRQHISLSVGPHATVLLRARPQE